MCSCIVETPVIPSEVSLYNLVAREACAQCVDCAWIVVSCKLTAPLLVYV